jgi:hypothetical protein
MRSPDVDNTDDDRVCANTGRNHADHDGAGQTGPLGPY